MSATSIGRVDDTSAWLPCPVCKESVRCVVTTTLWPAGPPKNGVVPIAARTQVHTERLWDHLGRYHGPLDPFSDEETQYLVNNPDLED